MKKHGTGVSVSQRIGMSLIRGGKEITRRMDRAFRVLAGKKVGGVQFAGEFRYTLLDKDGNEKASGVFNNGVTNEGLDRILNTMFDGTTQIGAGAWYIGLISATSFSALAAGDTYDSHSGWLEAGDASPDTAPDYTGDRKAWDPAASTAQSSSNAATVDFAMTESGTVKGIFLCSVETKGDATAGANNVLWATGLFPGGDQAVVNGDTLKITYTVNASAA